MFKLFKRLFKSKSGDLDEFMKNPLADVDEKMAALPAYPWRKMFGEGYIWSARLHWVTPVGSFCVLLLVIGLFIDITSNGMLWFKKATHQIQEEEVTSFDRFMYEPITTTVNFIKNKFADKPEKRKVFNAAFFAQNQLIPREIPLKDQSGNAIAYGSIADAKQYFSFQVDELNKTGKLNTQKYGDCTSFNSFSDLKNKVTDGLFCKKSKDENSYYFVSAVPRNAQFTYLGLVPVVGVIHKFADGWQYHDISVGVTASVLPESRVYPDWIAETLSVDFPEIFLN